MCAARILFELTGSIAAWKACAVISRLVQDGHEVQTVATPAALRFVGPATLEGLTGRPVRSDMWATGTAMDHIHLTRWADLTIVCPATANTINRLAAGLADDLVGSLFLAHDRAKPYLLAPAMNPAMWAHPATVASIEKLRGWGVRVLPVGRGRVACGDEGEGRLAEPEEILAAIREHLKDPEPGPDAPATTSPKVDEAAGLVAEPADSTSRDAAPLRRLRILITSGGTEEPIDGVRSIANFSTGRTGAILADTFAARGHDVTLLRARRAVAPANRSVRTTTFATFFDLESKLQQVLAGERFDAVIHAAAVSDYSVAAVSVDGRKLPAGAVKIDSGHDVSIALQPNPKLVDRLRGWSANPDVRLVAFKLTRGADPAQRQVAIDTLAAHARPDAIVHNDLADLHDGTGRFPATIVRPGQASQRVATREDLAAALEDLLVAAGDAGAAPKPKGS